MEGLKGVMSILRNTSLRMLEVSAMASSPDLRPKSSLIFFQAVHICVEQERAIPCSFLYPQQPLRQGYKSPSVAQAGELINISCKKASHIAAEELQARCRKCYTILMNIRHGNCNINMSDQ
ncbi:MAG: hypothetical protein WA133_05315 [Syntrophales bacterium]